MEYTGGVMRRPSSIASVAALFLALHVPMAARGQPPAGAAENEIQIQLFGQPCLLRGKFPRSVLTAIHSVGPEQIPPSPDREEALRAIQKLKRATDLPPQLESYRERFVRRLEAQLQFHDATEEARKSGRAQPFLRVGEQNMNARRFPMFRASAERHEAEAKSKAAAKSKSPAAKPALWPPALVAELYDAYNEGIEPNPEKEFHDITERKLGIRYHCSFGEAEDDEDPGEDPAPKPGGASRAKDNGR